MTSCAKRGSEEKEEKDLKSRLWGKTISEEIFLPSKNAPALKERSRGKGKRTYIGGGGVGCLEAWRKGVNLANRGRREAQDQKRRL